MRVSQLKIRLKPAVETQNLASLRLTVWLMCLAIFSTAQARIDAMQLRLLDPYTQDLRWDNIESAPAWINGIKPNYNDDWEMHSVTLAPHQQATVILPAYESLRLYHPKQTLDGKELDVYASNGSGLAVKQNLQQSIDGHSLVLSPHSAAPLLIHVTRKCCLAGNVEVAFFISRKTPLNGIAPYRTVLWTSAKWHLLGNEPFALPELYYELSPNQKQNITVSGPARIELKTRLHYEQQASAVTQDYQIRYWLDNKETDALDFSTNAEIGRLITVNGSIKVLGREEQTYLEIPQGKHTLSLQANRLVYVQALAQTEHDYLFRKLNNPRLPVEAVRKQGLLSTAELSQQEQTAKRIAQDNNRKAGGMVASKLLREAALKRDDYPNALAEAEQFRSLYTYYRDLLPSKKADVSAQFMAYFLSKSLMPIGRPPRDTVLADQLLGDALKSVSNAYFTTLSKADSAAANEYTLPEQNTDGQLRLIVDKRQCVTGRLHIELDRQASQDLWLRCQPELEPEAYTHSLAEAALTRLQQEPGSLNVSLDVPFSTYSEPSPLIQTAIYEIPLPKSVKTIKLWPVSQFSKPVNIALQYRASKSFSMSEQSYLAGLDDSSSNQFLAKFIADTAKAVDSDSLQNQMAQSPAPEKQQANNEWLPLQRLLQTEYRLYKSSVSSYPAPTALVIDQRALADETTLAKHAEERQKWLEALEHWGKVVHNSQGLVQQQAQLHQANVLTNLGETYLAESLFRHLSLYADDSVAEQAITKLSEQLLVAQDFSSLQTLAAAMFLRRPSSTHSRLLLNALLKNGQYRFALLLGLSLDGQSPPEDLLTAAFQLEWWDAYHRLQEKLPVDRRAFWQGIKFQREWRFSEALKSWADPKLKPWHDYLRQGLQLRDRLTRIADQKPQALYGQWAQWQEQHPGTKTWQNALWHIKDYAGSDTYYIVERDMAIPAFRATTERPVNLSLLGPATLNFLIRPLHPQGLVTTGLDGWLQVIDNDVPYRYPYTNNLPTQGLLLAGADNLQLGGSFNLSYKVGHGWHEIKLYSGQAPLSISVQEQRPVLAFSVLPPLNTDTFAEMGYLSRSQKAHTDNTIVKNTQ